MCRATARCFATGALDSAVRRRTIAACRADLAVAVAHGLGGFARPSSWLFCACGDALSETLGDWVTAVTLVSAALLAYLTLLLCLVCGACRGAVREKKRRKQNEFELETLKAAEREAGGSTSDEAQVDIRFV